MEPADRYDQAVQAYAAYEQAARGAQAEVETARIQLLQADPHNPAAALKPREYALFKAHPLALIVEILFGGAADQQVRAAVTPQMALLAGSVAVGQGRDPGMVLSTITRFLREHVQEIAR